MTINMGAYVRDNGPPLTPPLGQTVSDA